MKRWLARLAFAFLAVGFVLAYEGWLDVARRGAPASDPTPMAKFILAAVCVAIGLAGIHHRHRGGD